MKAHKNTVAAGLAFADRRWLTGDLATTGNPALHWVQGSGVATNWQRPRRPKYLLTTKRH